MNLNISLLAWWLYFLAVLIPDVAGQAVETELGNREVIAIHGVSDATSESSSAYSLGKRVFGETSLSNLPHSASGEKPNVILINLDDADYRMFSPELLELYPHLSRLAKNSISFTNLHVTTPFCGPSRASLFRGQYAHRTGVRVNIPESPLSLGFKGGYREFLRNQHEQEELGVWMQRAGYRTMMVGKYHHNGFDFRKPPGWNDFYMSNGGRYHGTYRFTTKDNPAGANSRNPVDVYRTDQEAAEAVDLIRAHTANRSAESESSRSGKASEPTTSTREGSQTEQVPFFLYLAPLAPHRPVGSDFTKMVDKEKYGQWQSELQIPPTPDFDEAQMSDKPLHRQSPRYSETELKSLQSEYVSRARAVKSVDEMIGRLMSTLRECQLTDSTYVFFTSDNGYQLGQHRLHNKLDPYQMCTNVPLYVSGPGIKPAQTANHLLAHIDICPTILELAGATTPEFLDGKSFSRLLHQPGSAGERTWRKPVVIENWQAKRNRGKVLPGAYSGLRYYDKVYVEWVTGDKEFYDLAKDPFELDNCYSSLTDQRKHELKQDLWNSRSASMTPIVTVLPGPIESSDNDRLVVRGYAEDDQRIARVSLTIRETKSQKFWNGKSWEAKSVDLTASLSADDQQIISWRYPIRDAMGQIVKIAATNEKNPPPVELLVTAWATDAKHNVSTIFSETVSVAR